MREWHKKLRDSDNKTKRKQLSKGESMYEAQEKCRTLGEFTSSDDEHKGIIEADKTFERTNEEIKREESPEFHKTIKD